MSSQYLQEKICTRRAPQQLEFVEKVKNSGLELLPQGPSHMSGHLIFRVPAVLN